MTVASYASSHLESSVITLFAACQPPMTAVLEWIWEGKGFGWKKVLGMCCVCCGMCGFTYIKRIESHHKHHRSDNVNADDLVRVSSEKSGSISRPGQTGTVRSTGMSRLFISSEFLGSQGINNNLGFQVPDLDALVSGSAQPVSVGGEDKGVDDFTSIKE
ncbi:hypothetical protein QTG54_004400 [Skeletonema marinoi]|uniref:Uncharacterized protein n=1 Tax=Skeletonema marinoi TaxID=267567 RepID=A0AAD9DGE4_9STRA|nr:hypothetical protein QTG54_004400 [Skeletonema marinoi]